MYFAQSVINSLGLLIEVDNDGALDLINSWSPTGRTRHCATSINFLRELKEQGLLVVQWISNVGMSPDILPRMWESPSSISNVMSMFGEILQFRQQPLHWERVLAVESRIRTSGSKF
jgi:hypothetical protein